MLTFQARHTWMHKTHSEELLICFSGWALNDQCFAHLEPGNKDVLVFWDYGSQQTLPSIENYRSITVVGYSMGVLMASCYFTLFPSARIEKCVAINGTMQPVSSEFGMDPNPYHQTIAQMSATAFREFVFLVAGDAAQFRKIYRFTLPYETSHMQSGLIYFQEIQDLKPVPLVWSQAILSKKDLVFPYERLLAFWTQQNIPVFSLDEGHFPFFNWQAWNDLFSDTLLTFAHD